MSNYAYFRISGGYLSVSPSDTLPVNGLDFKRFLIHYIAAQYRMLELRLLSAKAVRRCSPSALNDTALLNGSVVKSDDVSDRLLIALSTVASTIRDETLPSSQVLNLDDRSVVHEDILNKDQNPQYYLPPNIMRNRA